MEENYTKNIDNYIKANKIPVKMKVKIKELAQEEQERNFYDSFIYADNVINLSELPGNTNIYLN